MRPMKMYVLFGTVGTESVFISWWTLLIMQYTRKWRLDYRRRYIEAGLGGSIYNICYIVSWLRMVIGPLV